jgi:hypothetical protein
MQPWREQIQPKIVLTVNREGRRFSKKKSMICINDIRHDIYLSLPMWWFFITVTRPVSMHAHPRTSWDA